MPNSKYYLQNKLLYRKTWSSRSHGNSKTIKSAFELFGVFFLSVTLSKCNPSYIRNWKKKFNESKSLYEFVKLE